MFALALVGTLVVIVSLAFLAFALHSVFRRQRSPADQSNRINKLILIWFVLTREELFVSILPFLKKDLLENFSDGDIR